MYLCEVMDKVSTPIALLVVVALILGCVSAAVLRWNAWVGFLFLLIVLGASRYILMIDSDLWLNMSDIEKEGVNYSHMVYYAVLVIATLISFFTFSSGRQK